MNITVQSGPFKFEGNHVDAHEFTVETRVAFADSNREMSSLLNDFLFAIEVELQNIGYLTDTFDVDSDFKESEDEKEFPFNLNTGDEFCFENKYYTLIRIEWEGNVAKILANRIDRQMEKIECHSSEIS